MATMMANMGGMGDGYGDATTNATHVYTTVQVSNEDEAKDGEGEEKEEGDEEKDGDEDNGA